MQQRNLYLLNKGYLVIGKPSENWVYLYAKLIECFGVYVDKPELLNEDNLRNVNLLFNYYVPESFYANPQDLNYFYGKELALEQFVSYVKVDFCGVRDMDPDTFKRVEVFRKMLPIYIDGDEVVVRKYKMITEEEANEIMRKAVADLCAYTRPWSAADALLFVEESKIGMYDGRKLECADNAVMMAIDTKDVSFARMINKKDVVKYSIRKYGDVPELVLEDDEDYELFRFFTANASNCPLSKKQAKYYNTIMKKIGEKEKATETNDASPYKAAVNLVKKGDIVGAAKAFARSGALLERSLAYLLSRANEEETEEILDMIHAENPIVLLQSVSGILMGSGDNRVFTFYDDGEVKCHEETDEEKAKRRSVLSEERREILARIIGKKIEKYYRAQPSLGKIYVSDEFKKVAIPFNSSACGKGIDVLPTGSRTPMKGDAIRLFCYWKNAFDIDASAVFVHEDGTIRSLFWGNYAMKEYGDVALHSGDCRDRSGAEYIDIKVEDLAKLGYRYALFNINGYEDRLDKGEIYCGYQDKVNLKTKAWSAKNIRFKIDVKGDSREYCAFAIDLVKKEVVTLNLILHGESRVVERGTLLVAKKYLDEKFLEVNNMYSILQHRGEVVSDPKDADIVFASDVARSIGQTVIKPAETEKLVSLLR